MHITRVELGERSYPIHLGNDIIHTFPALYRSMDLPSRAAVVTDSNVAASHLKKFSAVLTKEGIESVRIIIPPGERQKSLTRANRLYADLLNRGFTRKDALIAFGGGVVGDLAGFVAATFRRGIPFVQVPTTLLAQAESAVGGKTGVNLASLKNAVGAFYQPKFVFSDVRFLATLPRREIICGLGEVVKYGYLDETMFAFLERHLDDVLQKHLDVIQEVVLRCNAMKAKMISEDERETDPEGGRMVLNLGHTIGQALEVLSNYRLHHGEAVLIALKWELAIARQAGILAEDDFNKLLGLVSRVPFEPDLHSISASALIQQILGNNKAVRFVLPRSIGKIESSISIDKTSVLSAMKKMLGGR
jgi:3-dehydroquinate synthase